MSKLRVVLVCSLLLGMGLTFGAFRHGLFGFGHVVTGSLEFNHAASAHDGDGQEFEWTGALSEGDVLEIKGINGTIEATHTSGRAQVEAEKEGRGSEDVRIEVVEHTPRRIPGLSCATFAIDASCVMTLRAETRSAMLRIAMGGF